MIVQLKRLERSRGIGVERGGVLAEILPGAEHASRAGQQHRADRVVLGKPPQAREQLLLGRPGEGGRPQRNDADGALDGDRDDFFCWHLVSSHDLRVNYRMVGM